MNRSPFTAIILIILLVLSSSVAALAQSQDRAGFESKIESLMKKLRKTEKEFLSPSADDVAAFAGFLRQADTGITRLLPREKYDGKLLTRGGGSYYSFTRLTHEYGYGSDIGLERNNFKVGFAGFDFGFITPIGDTPMDALGVEHPGVEFLAGFTVPSVEAEIRDQQRRIGMGFQVGDFTYRSFTDANVNTTYALRSISYRGSDVLIAFRVVRKDVDGSMIILWKVLKKFPVPELAR